MIKSLLLVSLSVILLTHLYRILLPIFNCQSKDLSDSCGAIIHFHIAKTGGNSLETYFRFQAQNQSHIILHDSPRNWNEIEHILNNNVNQEKSQWHVIMYHHQLGMSFAKDLFKQYREALERRGCSLLTTILFREPVSHYLSMGYSHCIGEHEFRQTLNGSLPNRQAFSQVGSFLFNAFYLPDNPLAQEFLKSDGKNFTQGPFCWYMPNFKMPYEGYDRLSIRKHGIEKKLIDFEKFKMSRRQRIEEGLELLEMFDYIGWTKEHDRYTEKIENITGWDHIDVPHTHNSNKPYVASPDDRKKIEAIMDEDMEFIAKVKQRFAHKFP